MFSAIRHAFKLFLRSKYLVDSHPYSPSFEPVTSPRIHQFSSLFSRHKKPETRLPRLPKKRQTAIMKIMMKQMHIVINYAPRYSSIYQKFCIKTKYISEIHTLMKETDERFTSCVSTTHNFQLLIFSFGIFN